MANKKRSNLPKPNLEYKTKWKKYLNRTATNVDGEFIEPIPYSTGTVHHRCDCCGTIHEVRKRKISQGEGLFCSLSCAGQFRKIKKHVKTCPTCGCIFRTAHDYGESNYCCIECEEGGGG